MKRTFQSSFLIPLIGLILTNLSFAQETISQTDKIIIEWIKQNSIPLEHVEAENGFSDLQPLKEILKDVKVVGLGENTHGTKEFFQVKHRLLEFLVTEMGFQAFAMEAPYAGCVAINEHVLHGKGDRETVLTGQNYVVWDTEEMSALIDWIRNYNKTVPNKKKVQFYGLDYSYNGEGAKNVLAYLQKNNAKNVSAVDSLFKTMDAIQKEKGMTRMDEVQDELKETMPQLLKLIDFLRKNKEELITASNNTEFDKTLMYTHMMKKWFLNNIQDSLPESATGNMVRSKTMAKNLFRILDMDESVEKVVVWEHNSHISVGEPETGEPNLGHEFRNRFGDAYYAIGFEFNEGTYQSRILSPDKLLRDLKTNVVAPAPKGYMAWYLSQARKGNLFLNLRAIQSNHPLELWLDLPQIFRRFSWISNVISEQKASPGIRYDGILFIETATATRPTPNALMTVSRGDGL